MRGGLEFGGKVLANCLSVCLAGLSGICARFIDVESLFKDGCTLKILFFCLVRL